MASNSHPDVDLATKLWRRRAPEWVQITTYGATAQANYDYWLGAVPPLALGDGARRRRGAFLCGEPMESDDEGAPVYLCLRMSPRGGACWGRLLTLAQFEHAYPPALTEPSYIVMVNRECERTGASHRVVAIDRDPYRPVLACGDDPAPFNWTSHTTPPTRLCTRCAAWERNQADAK